MPGHVMSSASANRAESAAELVCATCVKLVSSGTATAEPPQPAATRASSGDEGRERAWERRTVMPRVCIDRRGSPSSSTKRGIGEVRRSRPRSRASRPPARPPRARAGTATACGTMLEPRRREAAVGGIEHVAKRQGVADREDRSARAARAARRGRRRTRCAAAARVSPPPGQAASGPCSQAHAR